jgi:acid phosphatase
MNKLYRHTIIIIVLFLFGCENKSARLGNENLNGTLWMQTAVEYNVVTIQTFELAKYNLVQALNDPSWTAALEQGTGYEKLQPAVIVDVDETILDNTPFQARLVSQGLEFNQVMWNEWVLEAKAQAIAGAKEFILFAKSKGVAIFYVTNRALQEPTVKNLRTALDPDVHPEAVLCRDENHDWGSNKSSRRAFIAQTHRIILLLGDDYNDFAYLAKSSPQQRWQKANMQKNNWGKKWILLPNPLYGTWERALYNYDYSIPAKEKLHMKYSYLEQN